MKIISVETCVTNVILNRGYCITGMVHKYGYGNYDGPLTMQKA